MEDCTEALSSPVGHPGRASLLIGQRGFGKTSLLIEFAEIASELGYVTARVTANEQMLDEILQIIQSNGAKYIKERKKTLSGISAGALGFSFGLTFTEETERQFGFRVKLAMLLDKLAAYDKGVLLLIDEVQSTSPQMRELAATFQHLVGEEKNIAIVMAGLPSAISSVLNDEILTFLNRANKIYLDAIPEPEVFGFYLDCFTQLGVEIAEKPLSALAKAADGYPFMLQLLGYHALKLANGKGVIDGKITRAAIRHSVAGLIDSVHKPCLNPLSDKDIEFLNAMAPDDNGSAMADIQERLGVSQGYVQMYRKRLMDSGVVDSVRRGKLEIVVPYLREYLNGELSTQ
jgi:DNA-binding transcriptional ArsR family regulator